MAPRWRAPLPKLNGTGFNADAGASAGAACTCSAPGIGWHAGDQSATFSFNPAPSYSVLTVTPDGSLVRYVTIAEPDIDSIVREIDTR